MSTNKKSTLVGSILVAMETLKLEAYSFKIVSIFLFYVEYADTQRLEDHKTFNNPSIFCSRMNGKGVKCEITESVR